MSNIEHEAKILNINVRQVQAKIAKLGASKRGIFNLQRYVFDTIPATPNRWVRLRSDGHNTTLAIKEINSNAIDGTSEWEVTVSDIEETLTILEKIGIQPRGYQENVREEYELEGVQVTIDTWPKLSPYTEIEAQNTEDVIRVAKLLGYDEEELVTDNTEDLYRSIGIDLKKTTKLTFGDE